MLSKISLKSITSKLPIHLFQKAVSLTLLDLEIHDVAVRYGYCMVIEAVSY